MIAATWSATASVCSSVVPGTISMRTRLKSELVVGKNWLGSTMNMPIVAAKDSEADAHDPHAVVAEPGADPALADIVVIARRTATRRSHGSSQ